MSGRDRFLRLHHFEIVCDTGREAILRLGESLVRKIHRTLRNLNLVGGRFQVEQRVADVLIDLARTSAN